MGSILAVVIIALVGFLIYVYSSLGSILKDAVEEYGNRYTGVSVTLAKVQLAPESGQGEPVSYTNLTLTTTPYV